MDAKNFIDPLFKELSVANVKAMVPDSYGIYLVYDEKKNLLFVGPAHEQSITLDVKLQLVAMNKHIPAIPGAKFFRFATSDSGYHAQSACRHLLTQLYAENKALPPVNEARTG